MSILLLIGCGGFLGAIARYGVYRWVPALPLSASFQIPMGTLAANLAGCLLIGLLHGLSCASESFREGFRFFLFTGVLGSFTTFSTFGLETHRLLQEGHLGAAVAYVVASVALGIALVVVGHLTGAWMGGA